MIDDVERYAEISAALAAGDDRETVLTQFALTEDTWAEIDELWQERLSAAVDAFDDDGVPELIERFNTAFANAREKHASDILPFDRFVELTKALQRSQDVPRTLEQHGVTFPIFIRANQHWAPRIATEPELAAKFRKAME